VTRPDEGRPRVCSGLPLVFDPSCSAPNSAAREYGLGAGPPGVTADRDVGKAAPAEPPTLTSAVPNWGPGDTIPLGPRTLPVVGVRDDEADEPPVLMVEDAGQPEPRTIEPPAASRGSRPGTMTTRLAPSAIDIAAS
jgi:hypothetical protein